MGKNVQARRGWRRVRVIGLLAAAATVATLASASPALASTGTTTLCSRGNYASSLEFPARGGFSTYVINPGQCYSLHFGRYSSEQVNVYGYRNGATVYLGYRFINDLKTSKFTTYGSIPGSPYFTLTVS